MPLRKILQPGVNRSAQNRRHLSTRIQSSLLVVDFRSVYTTQERVTKTYPICDDSLSRPKQRSISPAQKSIRHRCFVCEQKPYSICDDSLLRPKQGSIAPAQKSTRNLCFVCERKPHPICFCCRHKSYPVKCTHSLKHNRLNPLYSKKYGGCTLYHNTFRA